MFVSVSCYGSDAQLAFTRDREGALAAGATNVSFPSLGDQTVAVRNSAAGTTVVYIRRGLLVADLTAPVTLDQSTLEALAKTVDASMTAALTSTPAPAPATGGTAVASEPPTLPPTASAVAESHVVPDLEARLPHTVKGTTLSVQSVDGTTALQNGATSQALAASLSRLGKAPADLQIAAAHDPSGTLPLIVFAFRVGGVSTADLGKAVIESWSAGASPAPTNSQLTIGGRKVTKVAFSQSPPDYMWEGDGVVFDIETTDESLVSTVLPLLR